LGGQGACRQEQADSGQETAAKHLYLREFGGRFGGDATQA
jgi:hypothetical protein